MQAIILLFMALSFLLGSGCTPASKDPGADEERFAAARARMVREQLAARGRDITNAQVLAALGRVPRHEFTPKRLRDEAYADHPLPIGHGQTISQPFVVAFMTQALAPQPGEKFLEIGTGSGYQAAVLADLGVRVFTIEIIEELARQATKDLQRLGYTNLQIRAGDGYVGWAEQAPFDAIIVTCAPERVPERLVEQLGEGGRMIIPVGDHWGQELVVLSKHGGKLEQRAVLPVRFVPMTGEAVR